MTHLIIVAHPSQNSFSTYFAAELQKQYKSIGWEVIFRDLYKIGFNPVLSPDDLSKLKAGETPDDILQEQNFIGEADLISVIYPLWWATFPAILKGYIDRVMSHGFAFNYGPGGVTGLLTGKMVMLHTTMGNTVEEYQEKGLIEAFRKSHGEEIFGFCGMQILGHYFYPQITLADERQRDHYLTKALMNYHGLTLNDPVK